MARNSELDSLKTREQEAFRRKQLAYQKYADAKDRASAAYSIMQSAWEERCSAREEMNREYESMQHSSDNYREVWGEYSRIRDANNSRIESLRYEADSEHQMMKDCFEQASAAYEYGDKSEAPGYAAQGHEHKDRRNELNEEVGRLIQEIRNAKEAAECRAPKTDSSAFRRAKEVFSSAKSCHESAEAEFKRLKAERDRAKAEFNSAQEEFVHLRDEFQKRLAEVKAENQRERDKTLDEAGINWSERDDVKIVKKADGTVQVYHGGLGSGDGLGHGHTAIDQFGHKTYDRGAFEEHGHQNYTDDSNRNDNTKRRTSMWGNKKTIFSGSVEGIDKSGKPIIHEVYGKFSTDNSEFLISDAKNFEGTTSIKEVDRVLHRLHAHGGIDRNDPNCHFFKDGKNAYTGPGHLEPEDGGLWKNHSN